MILTLPETDSDYNLPDYGSPASLSHEHLAQSYQSNINRFQKLDQTGCLAQCVRQAQWFATR